MNSKLDTFQQVAISRKTVKVLAKDDFPVAETESIVDRLLACAGTAPFHKVCSPVHRDSGLQGIEPWRFYVLGSSQCRTLKGEVQSMEAAGKIPAMLAAADAVILATWLPNPANSAMEATDSTVVSGLAAHEVFEPTLDNIEHIAAASAAVQTLLLAATAAGIENYWSSGGVLRLPVLFQRLGIPAAERLVGAIFLFPNKIPEGCEAEIATSKLRQQRCPVTSWSKRIDLA